MSICTSIRPTEFPCNLLETNRAGLVKVQYELLDTGVFDADRYFDVFVEIRQGRSEDILIRISVHNRVLRRLSFICFPHSGFATRGRGTGRGQAGDASG
jgi:hypothetical protein